MLRAIFLLAITAFAVTPRISPLGGAHLGLVPHQGSTLLGRISTGTPDTLEVYVLRVEFKKEEKDNSLTTGRGLFGSDEDTASANYSLDPQKNRASADYWLKHFEFADHYFQSVSNGKLVIQAKVFPQSGNSRSYQLDKYIIDYNRTSKRKEEKAAEFDEARSMDYMAFVWDAVKKAAANREDSPFADSLPTSPNRKRAYMIIHAGASRLVDGGSLGTSGADTPGDFFDAFVQRGYWSNLAKDTLRRADSAGMVLPGTALDTLREIMVMSETASQDGLNWGIHGLLVHQIARQIGMPATWDPVKGVSRMGYFDVMDYAGFNAGNGFLPVFPSAWLRAYMGWSSIREVRPGTNLRQALDLAATGSGQGDEIIKVPLSANEYLLLENRQRTLDASGKVTVTLDNGSVKEYQVDSLHRIFQDSLCDKDGANCRRNTSKATGIIVKASHYDLGLPASGVLVWHVNDWYLRQVLRVGLVNLWDSAVGDHQYGIGIVEADRILSIGKEFKNALGESVSDYGSGADMLPHLRTGNKTRKFDTVSTIDPTGYANTASTFGALSGIRITVGMPTGAKAERTLNAFMGDSVVNWRAKSFPLRVEWNGQWLTNSEWPRQLSDEMKPGHVIAIDRPNGANGNYRKLVIAGTKDGALHVYQPNGEPVGSSDTTVYRDHRFESTWSLLETVASIDSARPVPQYRLSPSYGALVGLAASGNMVYALHRRQLVSHALRAASSGNLAQTTAQLALSRNAILGPMLAQDEVWFGDTAYLHRASSINSGSGWQQGESLAWPSGFYPHQIAWCGEHPAVVGTKGVILLVDLNGGPWKRLDLKSGIAGERYQIACTDFNRDGKTDAFVLGDAGTGFLVSLEDESLLAAPRKYQRGGDGKNLRYSDQSPIALSDLNGDGLPDAVFYGHNFVYAIDSSGVPLQGFPARFGRGVAEYGFGESPLVVNADGKGNPEILAATTSGVLQAFDAKGAMLRDGWPRLVADFQALDSGETLRPVGLLLSDADTANGIELFSSHYDYLQGFGFRASTAASGKSWLMAGGGLERRNWLDASALGEFTSGETANRIDGFIVFPNPVRGGVAKVRFTLGAPASDVIMHWYDLGGKEVLTRHLGPAGVGRNQIDAIDCKQLGSDIYAVSLEVRFVKGKKKLAWDRIGVVK